MNRLPLIALATLLAGPALAQSAVGEWTSGSRDLKAITTIPCPHCAALPVTTADEQRNHVETRSVDGELKVFRTDAMMGGSPVTTISSATLMFGEERAESETALMQDKPEIGSDGVDASIVAGGMHMSAPRVDHSARTSSVGGAIDPQAFELRTN
jgi:hypothetical protein